MVKLIYNGQDFDDLDASGGVTISSSPLGGQERDAGREYTIVWEGFVHVAPGTTIAAAQTTFTTNQNLVFDFTSGSADDRKPLVYQNNDGSIAWAFDNSVASTTNNRQTTYGVMVGPIEWPDHDANRASYMKLRVTFSVVVNPCPASHPSGVAGISWWSYSVAVSRTGGEVTGLTYTIEIRLCDGYVCADVIQDIYDDWLIPDAKDRLGITNGEPYPSGETITEDDTGRHCSVTWTFGGGQQAAGGTAAVALERFTRFTLICPNLWQGNFRGVWHYKQGDPNPTVTVGIKPLVRGTLAQGDYDAVMRDAMSRAGFGDTSKYFPTGSGTPYPIVDQPVISIDPQAKTITVEWIEYANWIYDAELTCYEEGLEIVGQTKGGSYTRMALPPPGSVGGLSTPGAQGAAPPPYPEFSGLNEATFTYTIVVESKTKFQQPRLRMVPTSDNVFLDTYRKTFKETLTPGLRGLTTGVGGASPTGGNRWRFQMVQVFKVRDASKLSNVSVRNLLAAKIDIEDATFV